MDREAIRTRLRLSRFKRENHNAKSAARCGALFEYCVLEMDDIMESSGVRIFHSFIAGKYIRRMNTVTKRSDIFAF